MGKEKKSTIKFQKKQLKTVVKRRKDAKKFKRQVQNRQIRRGAPRAEKEEEKSIKTELAEEEEGKPSAPEVKVEDYFCNFTIDAEESLDLSDDEEEDADALDEFDANDHPKIKSALEADKVEEEEEEEELEEDMEEDMEEDLEEESEEESEDDSEMEGENMQVSENSILVTPALYKEWLVEVDGLSPKAWKKMLLAFRSIVRSDEEKEFTYYVQNSKVYTQIVKETLKAAYPILSQHIYFLKKEKYPGRTKNWPKLEKPVRLFLNNCVRFLRDLSDDEMIQYVIEHLLPCTLYFGCFPKISREYLRVLLDRWSDISLTEETRHACFKAISQLATTIDVHRKSYMPTVLKGVYLIYANRVTSMNETNRALIEQLKREGAEIYKTDMALGYEHANIYVRQLVDRLKEAKKSHTVESFKMIYTWQYINCLDFWMNIIGSTCDVTDTTPSHMQELIHPLINLCLHTIRLNPTAQFLPLRIHLLRTMITFMANTGFYVPLAPFLFEILAGDIFKSHPQSEPNGIHIDWDLKLKVPKHYLNTKEYQTAVFDIMKECFIDFYDSVGASMAFPELVIPAVEKLKEYLQKMRGTRFIKSIRSLIDKLERHKNYVEQKRAPMLQASDNLFK
ncbi:Noc2p family-domain-containing protein [Pilobolus umbonatus]|nr:Noc2p family-domain-containing protein [Pilobolus umbonatus]